MDDQPVSLFDSPPLRLLTLYFQYDALSGFSCPPSHIMTPSRARRKFPQLSNNEIKYCPIFYEGTHDDSRTNLAVAQTAAIEGACIANYCEAVSLLRGDAASATRVTGAVVRDVLTGKEFTLRAKSVLLCGGPFTDELRAMEEKEEKNITNKSSNSSSGTFKRAVEGASGIHIVLPAYFAPSSIGLVDMNTSDGRFMFFLPWKGHVLVGTTDHKCQPTMRPVPDESVSEIAMEWLIWRTITPNCCWLAAISHYRYITKCEVLTNLLSQPFVPHYTLHCAGDKVAAARGLQVPVTGAAAAQEGRAQRLVWHPPAGHRPARFQHRQRQQRPRDLA